MIRTSQSAIDKRFSWVFFVEIRVSQVYYASRILGLSRDAKYLNPRSRLWVIERDSICNSGLCSLYA